jgi:DNA polymerase
LQEILQITAYPEFKKALLESDCRLCSLHEGRTHLVVDRGNPEAKILIIGEAPGETEDLEGRAFVGRAGRLLDELFRQVGMDTERDALIANIVKCRPPQNRAPRPEEVKTCFPYLMKQIELLKPRFMILLGATAFRSMLPAEKKTALGSKVGQFFEDPRFPGIRLFLCYHPAYLLRDPRKKPAVLEMLKCFKEEYLA